MATNATVTNAQFSTTSAAPAANPNTIFEQLKKVDSSLTRQDFDTAFSNPATQSQIMAIYEANKPRSIVGATIPLANGQQGKVTKVTPFTNSDGFVINTDKGQLIAYGKNFIEGGTYQSVDGKYTYAIHPETLAQLEKGAVTKAPKAVFTDLPGKNGRKGAMSDEFYIFNDPTFKNNQGVMYYDTASLKDYQRGSYSLQKGANGKFYYAKQAPHGNGVGVSFLHGDRAGVKRPFTNSPATSGFSGSTQVYEKKGGFLGGIGRALGGVLDNPVVQLGVSLIPGGAPLVTAYNLGKVGGGIATGQISGTDALKGLATAGIASYVGSLAKSAAQGLGTIGSGAVGGAAAGGAGALLTGGNLGTGIISGGVAGGLQGVGSAIRDAIGNLTGGSAVGTGITPGAGGQTGLSPSQGALAGFGQGTPNGLLDSQKTEIMERFLSSGMTQQQATQQVSILDKTLRDSKALQDAGYSLPEANALAEGLNATQGLNLKNFLQLASAGGTATLGPDGLYRDSRGVPVISITGTANSPQQPGLGSGISAGGNTSSVGGTGSATPPPVINIFDQLFSDLPAINAGLGSISGGQTSVTPPSSPGTVTAAPTPGGVQNTLPGSTTQQPVAPNPTTPAPDPAATVNAIKDAITSGNSTLAQQLAQQAGLNTQQLQTLQQAVASGNAQTIANATQNTQQVLAGLGSLGSQVGSGFASSQQQAQQNTQAIVNALTQGNTTLAQQLATQAGLSSQQLQALQTAVATGNQQTIANATQNTQQVLAGLGSLGSQVGSGFASSQQQAQQNTQAIVSALTQGNTALAQQLAQQAGLNTQQLQTLQSAVASGNQQTIANATQNTQQVLAGLSQGFASSQQQAQQNTQAIVNALAQGNTQLAQQLAQQAGLNTQQLQSLQSAVASGNQETIANATQNTQQVLSGLNQGFANTQQQAQQNTQAIVNALTQGNTQLAQQLANQAGLNTQQLQNLQGAVASGNAQTIANATQNTQQVLAGLNQLGGQIGSGFGQLGGQLSSEIQNLINQLGSNFGELNAGLGSLGTSLGSQIGSGFGIIGEQIGSGLGGLGQSFNQIGQNITGGLTQLQQTLIQQEQARQAAAQAAEAARQQEAAQKAAAEQAAREAAEQAAEEEAERRRMSAAAKAALAAAAAYQGSRMFRNFQNQQQQSNAPSQNALNPVALNRDLAFQFQAPEYTAGLGQGGQQLPQYEVLNPQAAQTPAFVRGFSQGGEIDAINGGIGSIPMAGRFLQGPGDGMSDSIPANIDGQEEVRLAEGEYIIPAQAVSALGNGSSKAGAKVLDSMVKRVYKEQTGKPKQMKPMNNKVLPI